MRRGNDAIFFPSPPLSSLESARDRRIGREVGRSLVRSIEFARESKFAREKIKRGGEEVASLASF